MRVIWELSTICSSFYKTTLKLKVPFLKLFILKICNVPTYMFCFKEYKHFLYKCHFKGSFFFLKNIGLVPSSFPLGTSAPPVRFLCENPCNFPFTFYVQSLIHVYTQWVFVIVPFRKFISIDYSFYISRLPISCRKSCKSSTFNSCIVLSSVDVSFIFY